MVKEKPYKATIMVHGKEITVNSSGFDDNDYISITDMLKAKDGDFFISDWLRNRNTLEFLGIWEKMYNPDFNYGEFAIIKSQSGLNSYKISVKEWVAKTNAIGLQAKAGRYGGTYAHKDIAFEFGMWISPEFKLLLIKEYQRLKLDENSRLSLNWNVNRELSKVNYKIHTDAIKDNLIAGNVSKAHQGITYASEADMLNVALFGKTAKEWRLENLELSGNIRDYATVTQLIIMTNLESLNAEFIKQGLPQKERLLKLNEIGIRQLKSLIGNPSLKRLEDMNEKNKLQ